jgi:membrane fusion protein, copper/silver efflux system
MTGAAKEGQKDEERVPPGVRTMSVVRWGLVVVMGVVALLSIADATGALARVAGGGGSAEHATLYSCPMHPSVVQDHPGECPICSMTLVPKPTAVTTIVPTPKARSVPTLVDIDLSPERVRLIGMRTAKVMSAPLAASLRATGVVAVNERGLSEISVRFSGWVQQLMASETGRHIRRGEVLANVYSPEVVRAEQEYLTARGWSGETSTAVEARHRLELLGIAAPDIEALATRGAVSGSVPIRSPADGTITTKNVVPGAAVQAGMPLYELADLSKVWFVADVFEQDAARLRIGQRAALDLAAYPGERFTGRVQLIAPTLNAATRTLRVRLELANKTGPGGPKLRPGMYGTAAFEAPSAFGLVIPSEALVDTGEHQYVFVAKGEGHFEPRRVKVGARSGDDVQVTEGLVEGETVVTTGNFLLDSESRLHAAIDGQ